jgi:hypothetical protein
MSLLVDVLDDLVDGFGRNDGLQLLKIDQIRASRRFIRLSQRLPGGSTPAAPRDAGVTGVLQLHDVELVFLMQQLVKPTASPNRCKPALETPKLRDMGFPA